MVQSKQRAITKDVKDVGVDLTQDASPQELLLVQTKLDIGKATLPGVFDDIRG